MSFAQDSDKATPCWVADGDVEIHGQSFTPRRAAMAFFKLPAKEELPENMYENVLADAREGLQDVFDRPGSRAPFVPGYKCRDDAVSRARLLCHHGQESSNIIFLHLRHPSVVYYRGLENYAVNASYHGAGLKSSTDKVYVICEAFTKLHVERIEPVEASG